MGRSLKKGPYIDFKTNKKVLASDGKKPTQTRARKSDIPPEWIGKTIEVYNGKKFIPVFVSENHVGHKLGEFSPTRTFRAHKK